MKKLIVFALVLAMALAVPTAALADTFVGSPSNVGAPTLDDVTVKPADWDGEIIVTPYGERDTLPEEAREQLEAAYDDIKNAENVDELNEDLKDVAEDLGLSSDDLDVSTLFDISVTKEGLDSATLTLTSDEFENAVALLYFDGEEWKIVDATINGKTITFTATAFGPYAVVVSTDGIPDAPPTGESLPVGFIALAVLFGVAGVCFFAKSKLTA